MKLQLGKYIYESNVTRAWVGPTLVLHYRPVMGSTPIATQNFSRSHARVTLLLYSGKCRSNSPQISRLLVIFQNRDLIHTARQFCDFQRLLFLFRQSSMAEPV